MSRGASIGFLLDGEVRTLQGVAPTRTVLQLLREDLGRTGCKEGCAEGDCGACSVVLVDRYGDGVRCRAVNACIQFAPVLDGKALITVESLKGPNGTLHPVQQALADGHASQCGFCTPGFVMALFALYKTQPAPTRDQIVDALAGNLCRCTGYRPIIDAVHAMYGIGRAIPEEAMDWMTAPAGSTSATARRAEAGFARRLAEIGRTGELVLDHPSGAFHAPRTVASLAALFERMPGARILAGGSDLGLWVTKQRGELGDLLYVGEVAELTQLARGETHLEIGAAVTLEQVRTLLAAHYPELAALLQRFASPPVRNVATVAGNIVNASAVGDTMPSLIALGATLVLRKGTHTREIPLEAFYAGYRKTVLAAGEFVCRIRIPLPGEGSVFRVWKVAKRFDQDISTVCGAFLLQLHGSRIESARVAFGGMAATPARATACEAALAGREWSEAVRDAAMAALARDYQPIDDLRGSARYRMSVARNLLHRLWLETAGAQGTLTRLDALRGVDHGHRRAGSDAESGRSGVGAPVRHESAYLHVRGAAPFTDDIPELPGTLHAAFALSSQAHARIRGADLARVRAAPGVVAVLGPADVQGENNFGPILRDDPILADGVVQYVGQPMFLVVAGTVGEARRAARLAAVEYEGLPAILDIDEALHRQSFIVPSVTLERGDCAAALAAAPRRLRGGIRLGGQEHLSLEGHVACAVPREDGGMLVYSATQHPGQVQLAVARALGVAAHCVTVECRRLGGGFGGKETQPAQFACAAAVAARALDRPVKLRLDRDDDFVITGKRHDFRVDYEVGFDGDGRILGLDLTLASRCGYSADLSALVNDRAMAHVDNWYFLENVRIVSHRCKTHTQSNTAFRGFGVLQALTAMEAVIEDVAQDLKMGASAVRRHNFYVPGARDTAPHGMKVEDFIGGELFDELEASADFERRRTALRAWNAANPVIKRGIAMTPAKLGISFSTAFLNQASAQVHLYTDGSVLLSHGGVEMGQGLFTKVAQVVAEELGIDVARIRSLASDTSRIPNASATAASTGSDLNGKAAQAAARELKARLTAFVAQRCQVSPEAVRFQDNRVYAGDVVLGFAELAQMAYQGRVQLTATGFYATPRLDYDARTRTGRRYLYFAYGAAVSEVAIDTLTGETRLLRVDILHDVGKSLNPAIDRGQVEGAFVQGMGWLTSEELVWDESGRLCTHGPATYKIPVASDIPPEFNVRLYERGANVEDSIFRSKGVGEPPLMLALSVFFAIRDAIASVADHALAPVLNVPATPEQVLRSVEALRERVLGR